MIFFTPPPAAIFVVFVRKTIICFCSHLSPSTQEGFTKRHGRLLFSCCSHFLLATIFSPVFQSTCLLDMMCKSNLSMQGFLHQDWKIETVGIVVKVTVIVPFYQECILRWFLTLCWRPDFMVSQQESWWGCGSNQSEVKDTLLALTTQKPVAMPTVVVARENVFLPVCLTAFYSGNHHAHNSTHSKFLR